MRDVVVFVMALAGAVVIAILVETDRARFAMLVFLGLYSAWNRMTDEQSR